MEETGLGTARPWGRRADGTEPRRGGWTGEKDENPVQPVEFGRFRRVGECAGKKWLACAHGGGTITEWQPRPGPSGSRPESPLRSVPAGRSPQSAAEGRSLSSFGGYWIERPKRPSRRRGNPNDQPSSFLCRALACRLRLSAAGRLQRLSWRGERERVRRLSGWRRRRLRGRHGQRREGGGEAACAAARRLRRGGDGECVRRSS